MKNVIMFLGCFIISQTMIGQNNYKDSAILINYDNYKCTLFQENYRFKFFNKGDSNIYNVKDYVFGKNTTYIIWTPTVEQIKLIESNLSKLFNRLKIDLKNDTLEQYHCDIKDIDYILNKLNDYNKQYVGFIENTNKLVYINFYNKKMNMDFNSPDKYIIDGLGGGINLFSIDINYNDLKIKRIDINANM